MKGSANSEAQLFRVVLKPKSQQVEMPLTEVKIPLQ
jgi:hypothetical protein